jgi:AraC-like DNA-binding protein
MGKLNATHQNSILVTWVKAFGRALDAAGCNGGALLAEAGFDLSHLGGPDARCPLTKTGKLWRVALEATGDEAFGVKLASYFTHTAFHALGYGLSASSTLKEAFERVQQYAHVVSDAVGYRFYRCGAEYHFYIEPRTELPIESIDALVGIHLRMCRSLIGRDFSPLSVLDSGNPELARLSDAVAARYLARIERHNMAARVRTVLTQALQHGEPTQEEVAESLNVSARTLQRKLGGSGTTFRKILDEIRRAQALAHFSTTEMSVSEVTHLLGFSCSSSFTRAFKRWTGLSPSEWRAGSGSPTAHAPRHSLGSVDQHGQSANAPYTMSRDSIR